MVAYLSKSDASAGFDQIVDFLNAHAIQYALVVNPTIYVSCIKQFWATTTIKNVNDMVQLRALINGKKVVVTEDVIRQDLHLDDADGTFFSARWKLLIYTLVQCVSAKRTVWNEFSCSMASAIICLATDDLTSHNTKYTSHALTQKVFANMRRVGKGFSGVETSLFSLMLVQPQPRDEEEKEEEEDEIPNATSPHPQDPIPTPPQAQPTTSLSPTQEQPTETSKSSIPLLNTLLETCATLRMHPNRGEIEAIDADEDITLVDVETQVDMDVELQGRIDQDVSAVTTKDVSDAKLTVFDDEEKYQSLKRKPISIAQARKNMIIYLKNMVGYKMEHFRGMTYNKVKPIFEREYKKVQTLFKLDKDVEEPTKKRVAKETLLQESFKKLKAVKVSVKEKFSSAVPNVDKEKALWVELKRLFEPDAEDVLWKLQRYMHYPITWKLYYNYGVHQVSLTTRRHDMFMLIEKDYPLLNRVITLMLSAKLQVEEDSDMAKDLVMKIFIEANKPKSRSLDTSFK
nr:xylulose kinase-1 [Tanacetum cinerariifolium]